MVSVIIPCFNHAHFLADAVKSALAQTHPDREIIIVDDGSTDDTAQVARRFGDRVRYICQKNRGLSGARNRGITESRGDYIQFLDADDVLLPEKLDVQVKALDNFKDLRLSYCDFIHGQAENPRIVTGATKLDWRLDSRNPLVDLARRWETQLSLPPHCFLFDSRLFSEYAIRFDEALPNHEDWDCWMRVFALPMRIHVVERCLVAYRSTPNSMSRNLSRMRDGFLAAIDKQLGLHAANPELLRILEQKRAETAARYARKIKLSRFSLRRATKSFLQRQGARLPVGLKSTIKSVVGMR